MSDYTNRLANAEKKLEELKAEIAFLKLQIKQEKQQAQWAKGSEVLKSLLKVFPDATVENGAGCTYVTARVSVSDKREVPEGWELRESKAESSNIGAPLHKLYRMPHTPVNLYVIKQVF
jgi:hypothetical protein